MHQSDQEQIQLLKEWWHKYGSAILLAVAVYFLVSFARHYWQAHTMQQNEQASTLYTQMIDANGQHKDEELGLYAERLVKEFSATTYASLASLTLAKNDVLAGNLDHAIKHLHWVVDHSKVASLRQIAKIREARVLAAQKKYQAALDLLGRVDDKAFGAAIDETIGDIYLVWQSDGVKASNAYKKAVDAMVLNDAKSMLLMSKFKQFDMAQ